MKFDHIDENTFVLYAAKYYDNAQCYDTEEFLDDIKRFKYLKRLFGKYVESGELRERLILNHLIVIYNVFGNEATRMLFFKLDEFYPYLKPFLVMINRLPPKVLLNGTVIHTSSIPMDQQIIDVLRTI